MVRVHVRPPSLQLPDPCVRRVSLASPGKGGCRPAISGAFGGLPPREKLNSHSERRGPLGPRRYRSSRFFVKKRSSALPGRGAAGKHDGPAWRRIWRPGCTGARRMPWRRQAMKDAASCEKPRGGACGPGSGDVRMGQPALREEGAGA